MPFLSDFHSIITSLVCSKQGWQEGLICDHYCPWSYDLMAL